VYYQIVIFNFKVILWFVFYSGNTGVAVTLYDPKRSNISKIERESGVKFEHISAPRPDDIAKAVGGEAAEMITQVSDRYACYLQTLLMCSVLYFAVNIYNKCSVIPAFKETAEELLKSSGLTVVELLAKALAKAVVSQYSFLVFSVYFSP